MSSNGLPFATAAVLFSAALFALSFPPIGIRPVAFVCLVPLLLALRTGGTGRAVFLAWLWAIVSACAIAPALPASIASYYEQPLWVGWVVAIGLFTSMASLYYMGFAPVYRRLTRADHAGVPFVVAAAWVATELARGRLFTGTSFWVGNPWGVLGYTQSGPGPMAQLAAWTGVYGLSFAVVVVNAALVECWVAWRDPARSSRRAGWGLAAASVPTLIAFGVGAVVLQRAPDPSSGEGFIPIAVVQGNVALGRRWRSEFYGENLDLYLDLTAQTFREGQPEVVFWPEGALTFFVEGEPAYRRAIARTLVGGGAQLLAGGPSGDGDEKPPHYNSMFVLSETGEIAGRYDKQQLVPLSEFFPFGGHGLMRRQLDGLRVLTHGAPGPPLRTRAGAAGILLCNEAMLPEVSRQRVQEGAELLVNPSNDSWIGSAGFAEHMFQIVSLRAVEQGRYLVRASTSGPSAVVDPWGRVLVRTHSFERQILLGRVRPLAAVTFYGRVGDAFGFLCVGIAGVGLGWGEFRSRVLDRRRGSG